MGRRLRRPARGTVVPDGEDILRLTAKEVAERRGPHDPGRTEVMTPHRAIGDRVSGRPLIVLTGRAHARPTKSKVSLT